MQFGPLVLSSTEPPAPYEVIFGHKPIIGIWQEFGVLCHVLIEGQRTKMAPHTKEAIFLGYEEGKDGYVYMDARGNVGISRNVTFTKENASG